MNPTCDICGRKMVVHEGILINGAIFYCPATPDQHRIAELEKQVAELEAEIEARGPVAVTKRVTPDGERIVELARELRAREADVLALREALNASQTWLYHHPREEGQRNRRAINETVLSNTSATVEEIVARIEREAEERIFKAMFAAAARDGVVLDQAEEDQLRAAIFKEKG